jgi:hypothetical protein
MTTFGRKGNTLARAMCIDTVTFEDYNEVANFFAGQVYDVSIGMTNDFGVELPEVFIKDNKGIVAQIYDSKYKQHFHQIGIQGVGYYA